MGTCYLMDIGMGTKLHPHMGMDSFMSTKLFDRHMYGWVIAIGYKPVVILAHTSPFLG
jgi:hypothetical protein